ncbi:MAG: hypothetical protein JW726_15585 [Anaerolineales bacterium]|nr:hypothetical protein [Anaerolineales bacterium]
MKSRTIILHVICFALLPSLLLPIGTAMPAAASTQAPAAAVTPPLATELWVPNGPVQDTLLSGHILYIAGSFDRIGPPTGGFVGLDPDTAVQDTAWPRVAGSVYVILEDGSGGWYIGGQFSAVDDTPRSNLAHILTDGTLDSAWDFEANRVVRAMASSGNTLYIGGDFTQVNGQARSYLAAINTAAGSLTSWAPVISSPGLNTAVYALAATGDAVIVGGYFDHAGGAARDFLASLDPDSGLANSWDPSPTGSVLSLALYNTRLYVSGYFTQIDGQPRKYLAAFDMNTGNVTAWDPATSGGGMIPGVSALHISGNLLYIGGQFGQIGGFSRNNLAALDLTSETITDWDPNITESTWNPRVTAITSHSDVVYIGGDFDQVGGQDHGYIAAIDASNGAALSWDPQLNNSVSALAATPDAVLAGGRFTSLGGVERSSLAALDLRTGEPSDWDPQPNGWVRSMALLDDTLYFGGLFSEVNGQVRNYLAAVDATDGSLLTWDPDANNTVYTIATDGTRVFVGGSFSNVGGAAHFNLAALDPTTGLALPWFVDTNGPSVYALAIYDGTLYIGGDFSTLKGAPRNNAGAVAADTGNLIAWNPNVTDAGGSPRVEAIALSSTTIYLGGQFDTVNGQARENVAAVSYLTATVIPWNPGAHGTLYPYAPETVSDLCLSDNTLFIGGTFSQVGGEDRSSLAAVDVSSGAVYDWAPNPIYSVASLSCSAGTLYTGGYFLSAANQPQAYIAAITTIHVKTRPATNITPTSATLNGTATAYTDPTVSPKFEWGTTSGGPYPNTTDVSPSPLGSTAATNVSLNLTNLTPGQAIYYRLTLVTSQGVVIYGGERSFKPFLLTHLPMVVR